jgi:hypothetical protein
MIKSMEDVRKLKRELEAEGLRLPGEWGQHDNVRFAVQLILKLLNEIEELREIAVQNSPAATEIHPIEQVDDDELFQIMKAKLGEMGYSVVPKRGKSSK